MTQADALTTAFLPRLAGAFFAAAALLFGAGLLADALRAVGAAFLSAFGKKSVTFLGGGDSEGCSS